MSFAAAVVVALLVLVLVLLTPTINPQPETLLLLMMLVVRKSRKTHPRALCIVGRIAQIPVWDQGFRL